MSFPRHLASRMSPYHTLHYTMEGDGYNTSPMSYSHLVGGMINPMLPDGTMMTQREIKAVQARNRRMNRKRGGKMDMSSMASMFAYGMNNADAISDLTKLGLKLMTGKGRYHAGVGGARAGTYLQAGSHYYC